MNRASKKSEESQREIVKLRERIATNAVEDINIIHLNQTHIHAHICSKSYISPFRQIEIESVISNAVSHSLLHAGRKQTESADKESDD